MSYAQNVQKAHDVMKKAHDDVQRAIDDVHNVHNVQKSLDAMQEALYDIQKAIRKAKLLHLIEILEQVPEDKLDMNSWLNDTTEITKNDDNTITVKNTCNTVACAAGWACLDPEFNLQGLFIEHNCITNSNTPVYLDFRCFKALSIFFDINRAQTGYIFDPYEYTTTSPTPCDVIDHISEVMEGRNAD